jgi:copper chaperone CopZ
MGPLFAIFRPVAALISGIGVGLFGHFVDRKGDKEQTVQHQHATASHRVRIKEVFRYGFIELAADIGKWLIIGVVAGGILSVVIPEDLLASYFPSPFLHFLVILAVAIPLYVCATGSIPIAAALIAKGFSPGAALVFLIAGPATNTVTLSFVYSKLGRRSFYIYLAFIVGISLLLGWIFNVVWAGLGGSLNLITPKGEMLPYVLRVLSGVALLLLIANGFRRPTEARSESMKYLLSVPNMTCNHCKMTIEAALKKVPGVEAANANLREKTVGVDGDVTLEKIKRVLADAGYESEERRPV